MCKVEQENRASTTATAAPYQENGVMIPLTAFRVIRAASFIRNGIDLAGLFIIHQCEN